MRRRRYIGISALSDTVKNALPSRLGGSPRFVSRSSVVTSSHTAMDPVSGQLRFNNLYARIPSLNPTATRSADAQSIVKPMASSSCRISRGSSWTEVTVSAFNFGSRYVLKDVKGR